MNLESLKSAKFEPLSEDTMKLIVGGDRAISGGKEGSYSNDWTETSGTTTTTHIPHDGGDFSRAYLRRIDDRNWA